MYIRKITYLAIVLSFLNNFPGYVNIANEEFVNTMTIALKLRNFCIRLATEASQEAGLSRMGILNFDFNDSRLYSPSPNKYQNLTAQGLAIIFQNGQPHALMTPLGRLEISDGGMYSDNYYEQWRKVQTKLKFFVKGHVISKQLNEYRNEIEVFAIDEFDGDKLPPMIANTSSDITDEEFEYRKALWQDLIKYLQTQSPTSADSWILKYYLYNKNLLECKELFGQGMNITASECREIFIAYIHDLERSYWTTAKYPSPINHH